MIETLKGEIIDVVSNDVRYNIHTRYLGDRNDSKVFRMQNILNPFYDAVTDCGSYKSLLNSPVLFISYSSIQRLHYCSDCILRLRDIDEDFIRRYDTERPVPDDQAYKEIAILYFYTLLKEYLLLRYNVPNYNILLPYYNMRQDTSARNFVSAVYNIYQNDEDNTLREVIYDEIIPEIRMRGTYGAAMKTFVNEHTGDIPF
jgi:hypothetical protein